VLSPNFIAFGKDFGLRWQAQRDTAFWGSAHQTKSGVALCFPPQSKTLWWRL
jgi:hypothetical protein